MGRAKAKPITPNPPRIVGWVERSETHHPQPPREVKDDQLPPRPHPRRHLVLHRQHCSARHHRAGGRSKEHTSELQSLMRLSYAVFCLKKKTKKNKTK